MDDPSKKVGKELSSTRQAPPHDENFSQSAEQHTSKGKEALKLISQGRLAEAEEIYRKLIQKGSKNYTVYGNLGAIYSMQNKYEKSISLLRKSSKLNPNYPYTFYNLGNALNAQGELNAAINSYQKAIELKPDYTEAHINLGNIHKAQGDLSYAITCYEKELEIDPQHPEGNYILENSFKAKGDLNAAIESYRKALEANPKYTEAHYNLGNTFKAKGELTEAINSYIKVLDLKPDNPEALNNLGNTYKANDNLDAAVGSYQKALKVDSTNAETHFNLGNAFLEQGRLKDAITSYDRALKLNPQHLSASHNYALTALLNNDYKHGWQRYECRLITEKGSSNVHALPKCHKWNGELSLLKNDSLLVVTEQGLGDTLQFMRYINCLRDRGICISFCAQKKLHTLIKNSNIDSSPLTPQQANKVTDGFWIPLLSIPGYLNVNAENPIITEPYIKTKDELVSKWSEILAVEKRPIIGINWQGNPRQETTNSKGRSLILNTFLPITQMTSASLLSLQKGFGSEQLETCCFKDRFINCQSQINKTWDFLETAAIIANCDLIITSDTSTAHLAGGLGKTTWLLLKKVPDWRWGVKGESSFWYPSMRLFRQEERGNWDEVLQRVAKALQDKFRNN